jgi:hypothetical protein
VILICQSVLMKPSWSLDESGAHQDPIAVPLEAEHVCLRLLRPCSHIALKGKITGLSNEDGPWCGPGRCLRDLENRPRALHPLASHLRLLNH